MPFILKEMIYNFKSVSPSQEVVEEHNIDLTYNLQQK